MASQTVRDAYRANELLSSILVVESKLAEGQPIGSALTLLKKVRNLVVLLLRISEKEKQLRAKK